MNIKSLFIVICLSRFVLGLEVSNTPGKQSLVLAGDRPASVVVDDSDYPVVKLAARMFADDVERVVGKRPPVLNSASDLQLVIAGTLGHSAIIDQLVASQKLQGIDNLKGQWETTISQIVDRPFPGVERALVIVGSDRRGTAYGLMQLSEKIGVSPWHWWADVPTAHRDHLYVTAEKIESDSPAVRYRGIFINDEDWGLHEWAKTTFEPEVGGIGPKTYEKVFELMLRLRLNYLWPAMHRCSKEFHSIPENIELADRYGIVAGSSHCEPMLYNNVKWNIDTSGKWDYSINREKIYSTWEESARARGQKEAVWTIGIRGIHDQGMQGPRETPARIQLLTDVFKDQQALLNQYASKEWGPVAKAFVPYKEVLPLYDAGLEVPDDVTLVWVDDNFGYIRRLSGPNERKRAGGAGVYWHLSYYGNPHSYTWINSTAPALMWEEFQKALANDARNLWVINVGDIKPMEIGIDYFSKLAWNPTQFDASSQPEFLKSFATKQFGKASAEKIADLLGKYYRLGSIRKPELMNRQWAMSLSENRVTELNHGYDELIELDKVIEKEIPAESKDAYFELVSFPLKIMRGTARIFLFDRGIQMGGNRESVEQQITAERATLEKLVEEYNQTIAKGKWKGVMPGLETGKTINAWSSQVRWPWGEDPNKPAGKVEQSNRVFGNVCSTESSTADGESKWTPVTGLGPSGHALALLPAKSDASWKTNDTNAPTIEYAFYHNNEAESLLIDLLPTFRIYPGLEQRIAIRMDDQPAQVVEVPGSNGREDENGKVRSDGIQNNSVRAKIDFPGLAKGKHTLKIQAMDPGVVIDQIAFP